MEQCHILMDTHQLSLQVFDSLCNFAQNGLEEPHVWQLLLHIGALKLSVLCHKSFFCLKNKSIAFVVHSHTNRTELQLCAVFW